MVILFKGTDKSKNNAPQALALCAGLCAINYFKKTLVLQLTAKYPIENYVMGKRKMDEEIKEGMYLFEDTGMDSLTRRVGVTSFTEDHFANAVVPAVKSEHLFDILEVSKKQESDLEREILSNPMEIGSIISSAKKIYDNIFVLANGKNPKVIEAVLPFMEKSVTCVSQGIREKISAPDCADHFFLVTNYDYKSTYSIHQMMKLYGDKKTFIMPYNVEFKDHYTNDSMIQFLLHNNVPEKNDSSFHLISEMDKFTKILLNEETFETDEFRFVSTTVERFLSKKSLVKGKDVVIVEKPKKLFSPAKKEVHVSRDKKHPIEEEAYDLLVEELEEKKKKKKKDPEKEKKKKKEEV